MICTKCGGELAQAAYCPYCRAPVELPEPSLASEQGAPELAEPPASSVADPPASSVTEPPVEPAELVPAPAPSFAPAPSPEPALAFAQPHESAPAPAPTQPLEPEPALAPASQPAPAPAPFQPQRSSSKKVLIIVGAALAAIILIVGGVIGFSVWQEGQREQAYNTAAQLFANGEYAQAQTGFEALGNYRDATERAYTSFCYGEYDRASALFDEGSYAEALTIFDNISTTKDAAEKSQLCKNHLTLASAKEAMSAGEFQKAADMLEPLVQTGFAGAAELQEEARNGIRQAAYDEASKLLETGDRYGAYQAFVALGSFSDAAARAEACTVALPATGEQYRAEGWGGNDCTLTVTGGQPSASYYIKLYSGGAVVSVLFLQPGASTSVNLPAGTYSFRAAVGDEKSRWFGDAALFGKEGYYYEMLFDDNATAKTLEVNYEYTLELQTAGAGNVGQQSINRDSF